MILRPVNGENNLKRLAVEVGCRLVFVNSVQRPEFEPLFKTHRVEDLEHGHA